MKLKNFIYLKICQTKNILTYFLYKFFFFLIGIYYNNLSKKNNSKEIKNNKIVIFGSDSSVNLITEKEKKIISKCKIIFMNKNLIFWKYIKIWPDYYFLSDTPIKSNKAYKIFIDTINLIFKSKKKSPVLLLENMYKFCFFSKKNIYFKTNYQSNNITWARNKNEPLFGFHGSLTTLLNLILLYKIGNEILLVGFDMRSKNYFFDEDIKFYKYVDDSFFQKGKNHPNALKKNKKNIFTYWDIINKNLKLNNINLYCNNKKSLLCQKKLVKFKSISSFCKKSK